MTVPESFRGSKEGEEVVMTLRRLLPFVENRGLVEIAFKPVDYEQVPAMESGLGLLC